MSGELLRVRVQPRAARSAIVGWRADGALSVRVAAIQSGLECPVFSA